MGVVLPGDHGQAWIWLGHSINTYPSVILLQKDAASCGTTAAQAYNGGATDAIMLDHWQHESLAGSAHES